MRTKLSIGMTVILLSGIAFFASNAAVGDSPQSSDPNVLALKAAREGVRCYENKNLNCTPTITKQACALCDDELIITPPPGGGDDGDPTVPPTN